MARIDISDIERNYPALVLEYLLANSTQIRGDLVKVTHFENGRESGFTLTDMPGGKEITFANHRSSDSLVVYPYRWNCEDSERARLKAEENYKTKTQYFNPGHVSVAGEFIIGFLNGKRVKVAK